MKNKRIDENILTRCGNLLSENKLKLICAESMTAGFLSSLWALEVSSGDYFLGSVVCYDNIIKENILEVPSKLIETYTAESTEVTLAMLQGLQRLVAEADVYISVTGLAFDSPNPKQTRDVGQIYYAFAYNGMQHIVERKVEGNAGKIIISTCNHILEDLYNWLKDNLNY